MARMAAAFSFHSLIFCFKSLISSSFSFNSCCKASWSFCKNITSGTRSGLEKSDDEEVVVAVVDANAVTGIKSGDAGSKVLPVVADAVEVPRPAVEGAAPADADAIPDEEEGGGRRRDGSELLVGLWDANDDEAKAF